MRTHIDIDDELLLKAMRAGPHTSKNETMEAGLRSLARQIAYREILKWEGKLRWESGESVDWTHPAEDEAAVAVRGPQPSPAKDASPAQPAAARTPKSSRKAARRAGR